jgi:hypothetical protein
MLSLTIISGTEPCLERDTRCVVGNLVNHVFTVLLNCQIFFLREFVSAANKYAMSPDTKNAVVRPFDPSIDL